MVASGCELFWTCCKSSDYVNLRSSQNRGFLAIKVTNPKHMFGVHGIELALYITCLTRPTVGAPDQSFESRESESDAHESDSDMAPSHPAVCVPIMYRSCFHAANLEEGKGCAPPC